MQLFENNAWGTLAATITDAATSLTLTAGQGARFPTPTGDDYCLLTLIDLDGGGAEFAWEIVKVTARSTDTLTIVRAQDGTTAIGWNSGTRCEMRVTQGTLEGLVQVGEVDDTPADGATTAPISSNWAFDHVSNMHANVNRIGTAGGQGFGVGIYPNRLPTGFSVMAGTADPASDNYGNYQFTDGSVMCWVPKFYYRIGSTASPRYATYAANAIDIVDSATYATTAAATAAGYALHRAFIDGGVEQPGFFVDKYECSNNSGIASSLKNGNPLSTASAHNPIASLTGNGQTVTNTYAGCINAAKTRGNDFHCISRFQWAALALLATAHGQAASAATYCAWYDATLAINFPKGNNNNALKDTNDTSVVWESDGYPNCGKTGSAGFGGGAGNVFAKSAHNGQNCGVVDLNGNLYEVSLGMTCIAASKTITGATQANPCAITLVGHGYTTGDVVMITSVGGMTQLNDKLYAITVTSPDAFTLDGIDSSGYSAWTSGGSVTKGAFYVAKEATAMKSFTGGNTLATDHWGATGVAAMMEALTPAFATASGANGFAQRYGSTTNQVLEEETSGNAWLLTGLGLPKAGGVSAGGSNLFGVDYYYQYIRNELCLISGGYWDYTSDAGAWNLALSHLRTYSNSYVGFRSAAYV